MFKFKKEEKPVIDKKRKFIEAFEHESVNSKTKRLPQHIDQEKPSFKLASIEHIFDPSFTPIPLPFSSPSDYVSSPLQILCLKDAELTKLSCLCTDIDCSECEICQGSKKFSATELQTLFTKFVPSTKKFEEFDQVI